MEEMGVEDFTKCKIFLDTFDTLSAWLICDGVHE